MRRGLLSLLVLGLMAVLGSLPISAQDAAPVVDAPQVVDLWPVPGANLRPDEPALLAFNQPMNRETVEAALMTAPHVPLVVTWADDYRAAITARDGWTFGEIYDLTLSDTALSAAGTPLAEPLYAALAIQPPLQVSAVTPEAGNDRVAADESNIVVSFDRPVVGLETVGQSEPMPFSIEPDVRGLGQWVTTSTYQLTASTSLKGFTLYTLTVPAGLTAADGSQLSADQSWSFHTLPPEALDGAAEEMFNQQLLLDNAEFRLRFSQPMDHASVENNLVVLPYAPGSNQPGAPLEGRFRWEADDRTVIFIPSANLLPDTRYSVEISAEARSAEGYAMLASPLVQVYSTVGLPKVLSISPNDSVITPGGRTVAFGFNTLINPESVEGRVRVEPAPEGGFETNTSRGTISVFFNAELSQTYTVTLDAGVTDIYGNATTIAYDKTVFVRRSNQVSAPRFSIDRTTGTFVVAVEDAPRQQFTVIPENGVDATYRLYRVDPEMLLEVDPSIFQPYYNSYYYSARSTTLYSSFDYDSGLASPIDQPWLQPEYLLETLDASYPASERYGEDVPLSLREGEALPRGLYALEVLSTGLDRSAGGRAGLIAAVVNANISMKSAPDESLVWVTDIDTVEPLAGIPVTVYRKDGEVVEGVTDEQGVLRLPPDLFTDQIGVIIAQSDVVYGAWYASAAARPPLSGGNLMTDRPIYRPGEEVKFRGVLRDRDDLDYTVPETLESVHVLVQAGYYYGYDVGGEGGYYEGDAGDVVTELTATLSDYGTFDGAFTLPADLLPGDYQIYVRDCAFDNPDCTPRYSTRISFHVAEFRVPEFEVTVTAGQDEMIAGDPVDVSVRAAYYAGGVLEGARVGVSVYRDYEYYSGRFTYRGTERGFSFGSSAYTELDYVMEDNHDLVIGPDGTFDFGGTILVEGGNPLSAIFDATIEDVSGQAISGYDTVLVHPANVYIGLRPAARFQAYPQEHSIDLLSIYPDSTIRPNQTVQWTVEESRWQRRQNATNRWDTWENIIIPVTEGRSVTDESGRGSFTFTPPNTGIYIITATSTDESGRTATTVTRVYSNQLTRGSQRVWWDSIVDNSQCSGWVPPSLRLTADQLEYQPGDTASIFIPNPYEDTATALITLERNGILMHDVITIEGDAATYDVELTTEHAPTVFFNAVLLRGVTEEERYADYITASLRLSVEPVDRRLNVALSSSTEAASPGQTVTFDVRLTDWQGNPVQGEVGLALVDDAVLALAPDNSTSLESSFYGSSGLYVRSSVALDNLLRPRLEDGGGGCGGGGGGGGGVPIDIRDDFEYTPLWEPHVVTDVNGEAQVSVTLPDNLTRWELDARAVTMDTRVGQAELEFTSSLPLMVRPIVPRYLVIGDEVTLAANVQNLTGADQTVDVMLDATGVTLLEGVEVLQQVSVPNGNRARVEWRVRVDAVAGIDMTVFASTEEFSDAAKPALVDENGLVPVHRYVAPQTVRTSGALADPGSMVETIMLPADASDISGALDVTLDTSLGAAAVNALDYLEHFPYFCMEQTVSRFLPNAFTLGILREQGIEADPALLEGLNANIGEALAKMVDEQNKDGGWGWFGRMSSNPTVTAYALLGLAELRAVDIDFDVTMGDRAAAFLRERPLSASNYGRYSALNTEALTLYALARWDGGADLRERADALLVHRLLLSHAGWAHLLLAYTIVAPDSDGATTLADDLLGSATLSATGAYWQESQVDYWNWGTDRRSTALALLALSEARPDHPMLPSVVRWLMIARQGNHWPSTQETAWSVMALASWLRSSGDLEADYSYSVAVNGETRVEDQAVPGESGTQTLRVDAATLLRDEANQLVIARREGGGNLYYTAGLTLEVPADEAGAYSRGISVERHYYIENAEVSEALLGQIVTVDVQLSFSQNTYFVVIEDTLPAGLEILDTNLLTTAGDTLSAQTLRQQPKWYGGWQWSRNYFDRVELVDEGGRAFADFIPAGEYRLVYQARVITPGVFQAIPARAFAFYQPEINGHSTGQTFSVSNETASLG